MAQIKTESEYKAIMSRIDQLFFETDENTPKDDPRLTELDILTAIVEEYEAENYPIETPSLQTTMASRMQDMNCSKKDPTFHQAKIISSKLSIDPAIVLAL